MELSSSITEHIAAVKNTLSDFGSSTTRASKCAHGQPKLKKGSDFKQHLYKQQPYDAQLPSSNLYQIVSTCTNLSNFETQILERPYPQSPREAQSVIKVMSPDCVIMVTYPSCPRSRANSKNAMPRLRKASTPLAQPANNNLRDFGSSNTRSQATPAQETINLYQLLPI